MKKRKFSRVIFDTEAMIQWAHNQHKSHVENLSMRGVFIHSDSTLSLDLKTQVTVALFFTGSNSELNLALDGIVVRNDQEGVGIEFDAYDLDAFIQLRNIVAYNSGDFDHVLEEFISGSLPETE